MTDREKVIKGLEYCKRTDGVECPNCPYWNDDDCVETLHSDILELLKEQEAVKPKSKVRHGETCQYQHWCGNCMVMLHGKPKFCPNCGRSVKWE